LYKNGYKNKTLLKKASLEKLAEIDKIGMILAKSIKSQLEKSEN
jgi:DNA integrity scanning protein DisA with diadenylate cyclase activity